MPSRHTTEAAAGPDWPSAERKMIETKADHVLRSLIDGARKPDRLRRFIEAEVNAAEANDRGVRKELIGRCNRKITELSD